MMQLHTAHHLDNTLEMLVAAERSRTISTPPIDTSSTDICMTESAMILPDQAAFTSSALKRSRSNMTPVTPEGDEHPVTDDSSDDEEESKSPDDVKPVDIKHERKKARQAESANNVMMASMMEFMQTMSKRMMSMDDRLNAAAVVVVPAAAAAVALQPTAVPSTNDHMAVERDEALEKYQLDVNLKLAAQELALHTIRQKGDVAETHDDVTKLVAAVAALKQSLTDENLIDAHYIGLNEWRHPDTTMKLWCLRTRNKLWWEDINTSKLTLKVSESKGKSYNSIQSVSVPQKFEGITMNEATFIAPMCRLAWARMNIHGNKDVERFRPDASYKVKYTANMIDSGFSDVFEPQNPELLTNIQRFFKMWEHGGKFHEWIAAEMYNRSSFGSGAKDKLRSGGDKKFKDDNAYQRTRFATDIVQPAVTIDTHNQRKIKIGADLTRGLYESDKSNPIPYKAQSKYFHELYYNPPRISPYVPKDANEKPRPPPVMPDGSLRTHDSPRIQNKMPMYRARTYDEWKVQHEAEPKRVFDPYVLIPECDRYIQENGDLVFPICQWDIMEVNKGIKQGCGVAGFTIIGLIIAGEPFQLDESIRSMPRSVDRSQFFVMSQTYDRKGMPANQRLDDQEMPEAPSVDHLMRGGVAVQRSPTISEPAGGEVATETESL